MLTYLVRYLAKYYCGFNIFSCLTFRSIVSLLTAFLISFCIGPYIISHLKKNDFDQIIRSDGPKSHFRKCGTPTMGGVIILISIVISIFIWTSLYNPYIWYILTILISYGIIGFIDDYNKIVHRDTKGLIAAWKYFWMSIIAFGVVFTFYFIEKNISIDITSIKLLFNNLLYKMELFYILLSYLAIVGTGNAVNLTDGLDGLAIMPTIFISVSFSLIAWITSNANLANYLHMHYLKYADELIIICNIIVGASLGFLWFNSYPAQIFMGDIGSLSLGGTLGIIAVLLHQEFLLMIIGGIFVLETLSVILQISYFKLFRQRIFLMAPIHHHYELKGCLEPHIIVRFWIISLILVIIGLTIIIKNNHISL